jgi:hypothetical protein
MSDIETRLRDVTEADAYAEPWAFSVICREGADEIARLRAEIERLQRGIEQISKAVNAPMHPDSTYQENLEMMVVLARVRCEKALLAAPSLAASQEQRLDMGTPIAPVQQPPESD